MEKRNAKKVHENHGEKFSTMIMRVKKPSVEDVDAALWVRDAQSKQFDASDAEKEVFERETGYLWEKYLVHPNGLPFKMVMFNVYDKDVFAEQVVVIEAYLKDENVPMVGPDGAIPLTAENFPKSRANWHLPGSRDRERYGYMAEQGDFPQR